MSINQVNLSRDIKVEQEFLPAMSGMREKFDVKAITLEIEG